MWGWEGKVPARRVVSQSAFAFIINTTWSKSSDCCWHSAPNSKSRSKRRIYWGGAFLITSCWRMSAWGKFSSSLMQTSVELVVGHHKHFYESWRPHNFLRSTIYSSLVGSERRTSRQRRRANSWTVEATSEVSWPSRDQNPGMRYYTREERNCRSLAMNSQSFWQDWRGPICRWDTRERE